MPKAIKITEENRVELEENYEMEEDELKNEVGQYIAADFGHQYFTTYGILTEEVLDTLFSRTGKELLNGYFEIEKKEDE